MVRKVSIFICMLALMVAFGNRAQAATFTIYGENPSNTYIQYFRDIIPKLNLKDHYVAFRSGQNTYVMVAGDIDFVNGVFTSSTSCVVYTIDNNGMNNRAYSFNETTIDNFSLNPSNYILYSDLGHYPELEERGAKYEILTTILISISCVCFVVRCIFYKRVR